MTLFFNPLICKASPEEKGTDQYPVRMTQKPRIGDLRQLNSKSMHGSTLVDPTTSLHLQCLLGNPLALFYPGPAPENRATDVQVCMYEVRYH